MSRVGFVFNLGESKMRTDFHKRVVLSPEAITEPYRITTTKEYYDSAMQEHCTADAVVVVGYDFYEDYAEGYQHGLARDCVSADRHIARLATEHEALANMPNNLLLGYIHGKHRREHGSDCPASVAFAYKVCDDHLPPPPIESKLEVKRGRAIRHERTEKWVSLGQSIPMDKLTWTTNSQPVHSLADVAGAALRELLAK
jgi:hypothetical protein